MKRIAYLILFVLLAVSLAISTPAGLALTRVFADGETDTTTPVKYYPIGQNPSPFDQQKRTVDDISGWASSINTSVGIAATLNTADFTNTISNLALTQNEFLKYSPTWANNAERTGLVMLAQKRPNVASGSYTKDGIDLPANGYYILSVDYYILGAADTGYFTLVNSKTPNDKSKTIPLSKQHVANANPSTEYEYSYTEWTYSYKEYTFEDKDGGALDIVQTTDTEPTPIGYTGSGYQLVHESNRPTHTVTTRDKLNISIMLDGVPTAFTFDPNPTNTVADAKNKGFTIAAADGTPKTITKNETNKLPVMTDVGDTDDGYTLKKITDQTTLKSYWQTAYFFVKTDMLESASVSVTVGAKLGGNNKYNGVAYFDNFECWAVTPTIFDATYNQKHFKWNEKIDLTNPQIERAHGGTYPQNVWYNDNTAGAQKYSDYFQTVPIIGTGISTLAIESRELPARLGFDSQANFFHTENGTSHSVMLVAAKSTVAGITTNKEHNFRPRPHEVYMIQFYVTGASSSYYFRMGDDYNAIEGLSYPYHNAWQLCTYFVTGDAINSVSEDGIVLGFYIGKPNTSVLDTGWMAIDGFQITRVSGGYANSNSGNGSKNLNTREDSSSPTNAYFDRGTASDLYINGQLNAQYPYPLRASGWTPATTTADVQNGIMNTQHASFNTTPNPGQIPNTKSRDNNIYMMRSFGAVTNTVSAPSLMTTAGATTYISFDAQRRNITEGGDKQAHVYVRYTDPTTNKTIELGRIAIPAGESWKKYEFGITEGRFAASRSVELLFETRGSSIALYFDNVRISTSPITATGGTKFTVDPLTTVGAWTSDTDFYDGTRDAAIHADGGVLLMNSGMQYTTITNAFTFSAADGAYYKFMLTVRGDTDYAHIYVGGYDGRLTIMKNTPSSLTTYTDYTVYLFNETATDLVFKIDLGKIDDPDDEDTDNLVPARIYITKLALVQMEDDGAEYNEWKAKFEDENNTDTNFTVLTLQSKSEEPEATVPETGTGSGDTNFFGRNWWFLLPTLITAIAIVAAVAGFLFRKFKFDRHITRKGTSYARDVKIEEARKNIKAVKTAKQEVDKTDKKIDNNTADDKNETK